jgi:hypothetical protein
MPVLSSMVKLAQSFDGVEAVFITKIKSACYPRLKSGSTFDNGSKEFLCDEKK